VKTRAKVQSKARQARTLEGAGLALVVAIAALTHATGLLGPVDDAMSRLRFQLVTRPASRTLTVVEIDAASLRKAGAWPWSRARFARAIDNLRNAGAELIAFDVDFSANSSDAADRALEAAVGRSAGQVVLPTFVQATGQGADRRIENTSPLAGLSNDAVLASVNVPVDPDGRVRRYHYGFGPAEGGRGSMAATLAGLGPGRADTFLIDYGVRVADIDHLSFDDVYTGRFDPRLVRGRKVLIGATALELGDEFATPRRGVLPGVYVHALAYESLVAGRALNQLQLPVLVLLAGLAAFLLRPRSTLELSKMLRRHAFVSGAALVGPVAIQALAPVSIDSSPVLVVQGLCLLWVTRAELKRRAQAVIEAREAHLLQLAMHMRKSRNAIRAANRKLEATNTALDKALKARTEFLATTSHEIRTPLNGILGTTQVILAQRELPDRLRERVAVIHGAGETLLALVDDILDAAKLEAGHLTISPAELDLHHLLEDAARLWSEKAASKGLTLRTSFEGAPAWIREDAMRLRQIVSNLISNAVKFTETGQVEVSAGSEMVDGRETLVVTIADTGIGIAADKLETIFEAFRQGDGGVTRKYGGTGLGLSISRQLATAMGGALTVVSEPGNGAVFTLRLPLQRAEVRETEVEAGAQSAPANSLEAASVLLLEANPLARSMLKAVLAPETAAVLPAATIEEAVAAMRARRFDLILVEGKTLSAEADACETLGRLAAGCGAARICVLWSGEADAVAQLLAAGADGVARKPIAAPALVAQLRGMLSTPGLAVAAAERLAS
jgi:signal transduction histidine kinase/CheY-like chemotaxis protein